MEIERRWLVEPPDSDLPRTSSIYSIRQHYLTGYLTGSDPIRRIRCTVELSNETAPPIYHYTEKRHIEKGIAEETEQQISFPEYLELSKHIDAERGYILKWRHKFVYRKQTFELDQFFKPKDLWILELELDSIDQKISLPPFLTIVREITGEAEFSNYHLAKRTA